MDTATHTYTKKIHHSNLDFYYDTKIDIFDYFLSRKKGFRIVTLGQKKTNFHINTKYVSSGSNITLRDINKIFIAIRHML